MSIKSLIARWLAPALPVPAPEAQRETLLSDLRVRRGAQSVHRALSARIEAAKPRRLTEYGTGMDASAQALCAVGLDSPEDGDVLFAWYGAQSPFIGHQLAAIIATHWLVGKLCSVPARDAIRQGFTLGLEGTATDDGPEKTAIEKANKRFGLNRHMREFVQMGRVFGIRICIFKVKTADPKSYYAAPFNADAITPNSYEGMVQVDPYWCSPELDWRSVSDPASPEFYEPTWWRINGIRYHRTHLAIFRTEQPADVLKPQYQYGGIPLPQRIMERVYAAERTASEAPQLAMSKRLTTWATDIEALLIDEDKFAQHMAVFTATRDNFGVKIVAEGDTMEVHDTALADMDALIMTQYQLVCAAGGCPSTKVMGTTPKGFSATGEYDESSYHEELETIQENDLTPFMDRHLECVIRSEIEPKFGLARGTVHANVNWEPLDSPTAEEYSTINKANAETDEALVGAGAIDGMDVRNRLRKDRNSGYFGLSDMAEATDPLDAAIEALGGTVPGDDPLEEATAALTGGDPLEAATQALGAPAQEDDQLSTAIKALELG